MVANRLKHLPFGGDSFDVVVNRLGKHLPFSGYSFDVVANRLKHLTIEVVANRLPLILAVPMTPLEFFNHICQKGNSIPDRALRCQAVCSTCTFHSPIHPLHGHLATKDSLASPR